MLLQLFPITPDSQLSDFINLLPPEGQAIAGLGLTALLLWRMKRGGKNKGKTGSTLKRKPHSPAKPAEVVDKR